MRGEGEVNDPQALATKNRCPGQGGCGRVHVRATLTNQSRNMLPPAIATAVGVHTYSPGTQRAGEGERTKR